MTQESFITDEILQMQEELAFRGETVYSHQPVCHSGLFEDGAHSELYQDVEFVPNDEIDGGDMDESEDDNYGIGQIREIMSRCKESPDERPGLSYIALIGMAIQTSEHRRMLLNNIYQWIMDNFPFFKSSDRSWRNSVRHNLSLNECFVKTGRSDNGKGNYWIIHPANVDDFSQGDFRRRMARIKVRQSKSEKSMSTVCASSSEPAYIELNALDISIPQPYQNNDLYEESGWVPMTQWSAPVYQLLDFFGPEAIFSKQEINEHKYKVNSSTLRHENHAQPFVISLEYEI